MASMMASTRAPSCARAASVAATRSLVTPANAETTIIGLRSRRSATMSIAFATRLASPTDVPPNLMTIMDGFRLTVASCQLRRHSAFSRSPLRTTAPTRQPAAGNRQPSTAHRPPSSQQPLCFEQLRVEDGCSGRASDRVVHKRHHPQVEQWTWTEAADRDAHPVLPVAVQARLRAVVSIDIVNRRFRRGRETEPLRLTAELLDHPAYFVEIVEIPAQQSERDRHQMPADGGYPIHLRGDAKRGWL